MPPGEQGLRSAMHLQVVRKERAVGVVPQAPTVYEVLEEIVITVQAQLVDASLPFCAFNGGADVFVDVGNKSLGLEALMKHLNFRPHQVGRMSHLRLRSTPPASSDGIRICYDCHCKQSWGNFFNQSFVCC